MEVCGCRRDSEKIRDFRKGFGSIVEKEKGWQTAIACQGLKVPHEFEHGIEK